MLSPLFLHAQFVESLCSTIPTNDYSYTQKVRKYTKDKIIALSENTNGIYYFYLIEDGNIIVNYIDLPNQYKITDFQILDDNVYFCGSHADANHVLASVSYDTLTPIPNTKTLDSPSGLYEFMFDSALTISSDFTVVATSNYNSYIYIY